MEDLQKLLIATSSIATLGDLRSVIAKSLAMWLSDKDPVGLYLLAHVIQDFRGAVSQSFFESQDLIPDADHYFSMAYHAFMELHKLGDPKGAIFISHYYKVGLCPVERSQEDFLIWLKKAADLGHPNAIAELGLLTTTVQ